MYGYVDSHNRVMLTSLHPTSNFSRSLPTMLGHNNTLVIGFSTNMTLADTTTDANSREMIEAELPQPAPTSIGRTRDAAEDVKTETPSTSPSSGSKLNDDDSKANPVRDAGGGKVRGPNGRYLSKDDDLSSLKKIKKPRGKGGRPSLKSSDESKFISPLLSPMRSHCCPLHISVDQAQELHLIMKYTYLQSLDHLMTVDGFSDKPDELSTGDDDISVKVQTPSTPPPDQKIEEQNSR